MGIIDNNENLAVMREYEILAGIVGGIYLYALIIFII